jgi:hypothetical protein
MKTKTFLLLCLFLGIGLTQLSAQTGSVVTKESGLVGYSEKVINCNGETDVLNGAYSMTYIWHFKDGIFVWGISSVKVEVTSENTNEVFVGHANYKYTEATCLQTWHLNFKGNMGSHYIESFTWNVCLDPDMEHIVVNKIVCIENGKK